MTAIKTPRAIADPTPELLEEALHLDGMEPRWWSNGPGDQYAAHSHPYHKVLYCSAGSIVFHTHDGDLELGPGDRLDISPATEHSATVGPDGVTCVEAPLPPTP